MTTLGTKKNLIQILRGEKLIFTSQSITIWDKIFLTIWDKINLITKASLSIMEVAGGN